MQWQLGVISTVAAVQTAHFPVMLGSARMATAGSAGIDSFTPFRRKKGEKRYVRAVSVKLFTSGMILCFRRCRDEALLQVGSIIRGNKVVDNETVFLMTSSLSKNAEMQH